MLTGIAPRASGPAPARCTRPVPLGAVGAPSVRVDERATCGPGNVGATVTLVALTLASAIGLLRGFTGRGWMAPVVLTALGVHLACWAASARSPTAEVVALVLGLAARMGSGRVDRRRAVHRLRVPR